jgi:hypothetical protein
MATIGVMFVAVFLMSHSDIEAKPKRPQMCGGGCTCDQLAKARSENPGGVQACLDKIISTGVEHYVGCGQGGPGCCHMNGIVETCELFRPQPPAGGVTSPPLGGPSKQRPGPVPGAPVPPSMKR